MVAASRPIKFGFLKLCLDTSIQILTSLTRPPSRAVGGVQRRKKALLIGINYEGNEGHMLKTPQADVESMKRLLIECYNFSEEDIVVLSDRNETSLELTPDYKNIMWQLQYNFVKNEEATTDYFFVYSGHSWQREEEVLPGESSVEEDGQEEFIIPRDALKAGLEFCVEPEKVVTDKLLKKYLVKRLAKGSQLVAFFDSCHSGTLLNLKHYRCNRSGDLISLMQDTARLLLIEPLLSRSSRGNAPGVSDPSTFKKSGTIESTLAKGFCIPWKGKIDCHGFCPRLHIKDKPQVVCVSACKDQQNVVEAQEGTMIPAIVNLLREQRSPTYRELMRAARSGAEARQKAFKDHVKSHMKGKKCHWPLNYVVNIHRRCCTPEEKDWKQMLRLGCDPQLSSRKPLNTKGKLRI